MANGKGSKDDYVDPQGWEPSDYNFIKSPTPINIKAAIDNGSLTPQTEKYMRDLGLWTEKTDAALKELNKNLPNLKNAYISNDEGDSGSDVETLNSKKGRSMADNIVRENPYANDQSSAPVTWGTPDMYKKPEEQNSGAPVTWGTPEMYKKTEQQSSDTPTRNPRDVSGYIVRDNPFGVTLPPPPVTSSDVAFMAPTANKPAPEYQAPPPADTRPLSTEAYQNKQIQSIEQERQTGRMLPNGQVIAGSLETENQARAAEERARIQHNAWVDEQFRLYGNPEKFHKAQQDMAAAQALPMNDPNRAAKIQQAQADMYQHEGSAPALARTMADQKAREDRLLARINEARAMRVDPDKWWNDKSTGGKILAGIGIVLGGIGGGMTGQGGNTALTVINNAIDRDIDSQKHHIDNSWKAIAAENGLNKEAFDREMHNQVWQNNARQGAYQIVKDQLQEIADRTQSQTVKNNALAFNKVLDGEQDKLRYQKFTMAIAARQAEINRLRSLSKEADKDVQKLMESGKYTYDEAADVVYSRPHNRELIGVGLAPAGVTLSARTSVVAADQLSKLEKLGITGAKADRALASDPKFDRLFQPGERDKVLADPNYVPKYRQTGPAIPADIAVKREGKSDVAQQHFEFQVQKDLRERTATIDGRQYIANTSKEADDASKKAASVNEVLRVIKGIKDIRERNKDSLYMGSEDRAALDELLRQGTLHYPLAMTGSLRINPEELKKGSQTFSGEGDWFRTDALNRKAATLDTLTDQLEARKEELRQGLVPADKNAPAAPATKPQGNVGNDGKQYGVGVK